MKILTTLLACLFVVISLGMPVSAYAAEDWYEGLESMTPVQPHKALNNLNKNIVTSNLTGNCVNDSIKKDMLLNADSPMQKAQKGLAARQPRLGPVMFSLSGSAECGFIVVENPDSNH